MSGRNPRVRRFLAPRASPARGSAARARGRTWACSPGSRTTSPCASGALPAAYSARAHAQQDASDALIRAQAVVNADCGGGARGRRAVPGVCMLRSRTSRSCWEGCPESSDDRIRAKKDGQNVFLSSFFTRNTVSRVLSVRGSGVVLPFILVGPPSAHKYRRMSILKCCEKGRKGPKTSRRVSRSAAALYAIWRKHRAHPRG